MSDNVFSKTNGGFERVVAPGDTLSNIARDRGISLEDLIRLNPQYQGPVGDPNKIFPGQRVILGGVTQTPNSPLPTGVGATTPSGAPSYNPAPTPSTTPAAAPTTDPLNAFLQLSTNLLTKAKGVDTLALQKRRRELELGQVSSAEMTPEEVGTLSPSQQDAIRSGRMSASEPLLEENKYELAKAQKAIDNFADVHAEAMKIGKDFADKMAAPDSVINSAKMVVENDPSQLSTVLAGLNDKSKEKLLGVLDYTKMKPKSTVTPNQITDNESAARNFFVGQPIVKDYNTILSKKLVVDSILNSKLGGPGDLSVVYEFMKALDPTSVVRETEYESAAKSGNIFTGALAKFNGYLKPNGGFLPDNVKQAFQSIINTKLAAQTQLYNNFVQDTKATAIRQGLNPDNVIPNFSGAAGKPILSPEVQSKVDAMRADKIPDNVIEQVIGQKLSFSGVGGDTDTASEVKRKLAVIESGGKYTAVSPVNRNGERAYGKYQILASNIPVWGREALGYSPTLEQFMASPQIQEAIMDYRIKTLRDEGYDDQNIASIHFSGRPLANNNRQDVTGTSVPEYVRRFNEA